MTPDERMDKVSEVFYNEDLEDIDLLDELVEIYTKYFNEYLGELIAFEQPMFIAIAEFYIAMLKKDMQKDTQLYSVYNGIKKFYDFNYTKVDMPNFKKIIEENRRKNVE